MSIYVQRRGKAHSSTISLQGMQHRLAAGMIRSASFPRDTTTQDSKVRWWKPTTRLSTSSDVPFFLSPTCQWNRNDLTNPNYTSLLTYVHFPNPSFNFPDEISGVLNYRTSYAISSIPRPASHSHHSRLLVTLRNLRFYPQLRGALSSKRKQNSRDRVR